MFSEDAFQVIDDGTGGTERVRHDYALLLQDEAVLNDEFLVEVLECVRAFLPGRRPPLMYHIEEFAQRWVVSCLVANLLELCR